MPGRLALCGVRIRLTVIQGGEAAMLADDITMLHQHRRSSASSFAQQHSFVNVLAKSSCRCLPLHLQNADLLTEFLSLLQRYDSQR